MGPPLTCRRAGKMGENAQDHAALMNEAGAPMGHPTGCPPSRAAPRRSGGASSARLWGLRISARNSFPAPPSPLIRATARRATDQESAAAAFLSQANVRSQGVLRTVEANF